VHAPSPGPPPRGTPARGTPRRSGFRRAQGPSPPRRPGSMVRTGAPQTGTPRTQSSPRRWSAHQKAKGQSTERTVVGAGPAESGSRAASRESTAAAMLPSLPGGFNQPVCSLYKKLRSPSPSRACQTARAQLHQGSRSLAPRRGRPGYFYITTLGRRTRKDWFFRGPPLPKAPPPSCWADDPRGGPHRQHHPAVPPSPEVGTGPVPVWVGQSSQSVRRAHSEVPRCRPACFSNVQLSPRTLFTPRRALPRKSSRAHHTRKSRCRRYSSPPYVAPPPLAIAPAGAATSPPPPPLPTPSDCPSPFLVTCTAVGCSAGSGLRS
jgi:hypothetical protein